MVKLGDPTLGRLLRCRDRHHVGNSPTDPDLYVHLRGKPIPLCLVCNARKKAAWKAKKTGVWGRRRCQDQPVDRQHIANVLRGPDGVGRVAKFTKGALCCAKCFRLKPANGRYFPMTDDLRTKPICLVCIEREPKVDEKKTELENKTACEVLNLLKGALIADGECLDAEDLLRDCDYEILYDSALGEFVVDE